MDSSKYFKNSKNYDEKKFLEKLLSSQLDEILTCTDVNIAAELLVSKLTNILDEMAPIKTVQTEPTMLHG